MRAMCESSGEEYRSATGISGMRTPEADRLAAVFTARGAFDLQCRLSREGPVIVVLGLNC